jgi:hypothetical protein
MGSMDVYMYNDKDKRHGHENAVWTWTRSMDIDMDFQHGQQHAPWTATCIEAISCVESCVVPYFMKPSFYI